MKSPHGTHARYSKGCRCEECKVAHRAYEREASRRRRRMRAGIDFYESRLVDISEARAHIVFLRSRGLGLDSIAERAGVSRATIQRVCRSSSKKITRDLEERILGIPAIVYKRGTFVSAQPLKDMLKELSQHGITEGDVARSAGMARPQLNIKNKVRFYKFKRVEHACLDLLRVARD